MKDKTQKAWNFIKAFTEANSYPPSVREIRDEIGVSSTSVVIYHLKKLDEAGLIKRQGAGRRMLVCGAVTKINPIPSPSPQTGKADKPPLTPDPFPHSNSGGNKIYQVVGREYPSDGP